MDAIQKIFSISKTAQILDEYKPAEISGYIHSGSYIYNAHLSGSLFGGFPEGRMTTIAGDPKTGKSFFVYNGMREFQKKYEDGVVYLFETEGALTKDRLLSMGVDPTRVIMEQPETVDDVIIPLTKLTDDLLKVKEKGKEELPKIMVAIDSITALNSQKQFDDALAGKAKQDMGTVAKDLKRLFNMMMVRFGKLDMTCVVTAHVYEKDMGHFRKKVPTGGNAAIFMSTVVSMLRKNDDRDADKQKIGIFVNADIVESRESKPIPTTVYINFTKGMNPYFGLERFISWENCGIARGKMVDFVDILKESLQKGLVSYDDMTSKKLSVKDFTSVLSKKKAEGLRGYIEWFEDNGYLTYDVDGFVFTEKCKDLFDKDMNYVGFNEHPEKVHFVNQSSTNWIAKHLNESFPTKELFTPKVFTRDVLEQLDENIIKPLYKLGDNNKKDVIDTDNVEVND